jgi:hypothetical protein
MPLIHNTPTFMGKVNFIDKAFQQNVAGSVNTVEKQGRKGHQGVEDDHPSIH